VTDIATSPLALAPAPRFSIGRTLSLTFAVLWRNLWRMSVVAVAVTALQLAIELYVPLDDDSVIDPFVGFFANLLNSAVLLALAASPVAFATLQHLGGNPTTFAGMLGGGLRRVVRVLIGGGLWLLALLLPSTGLLIAGLWLGLPEILMLAGAGIYILAVFSVWFVVVPVLVAEDVRLLSSFGRSGRLTRDHRWGVLALALILIAVIVAMMAIAWSLHLALVVYAPVPMMLYSWGSLVAIPFGAFSTLMTAIIPAVAYHLLRTEREGGAAETVARVFD
jgi:hypothetical protein